MPSRNIRLTVEYKGTSFAGWQIQKDQITVQGEITRAIAAVTQQEVNLIGAGRTDSGVHALGQVANFRIDHDLPAERFAPALNFHLPDDIRILRSEAVDYEFHARYDATWRRYRYLVASERSALWRDYRWETDRRFDHERLNQAAALILGSHDFSPFCVVSSLKENNECTIGHAKWRQVGPLLVFEIRGNRFLHSMVRSVVGAMLNLADTAPDDNPHNLTLPAFRDIILAPQRQRVTFTAPAHGLYLVAVGYGTGSA